MESCNVAGKPERQLSLTILSQVTAEAGARVNRSTSTLDNASTSAAETGRRVIYLVVGLAKERWAG